MWPFYDETAEALDVVIPYLVEPQPWWESSMVSGLVGAIVGAVIGGGISWLLAWQSSRATLRRDAAERVDQEKAVTRTVIIKTQNTVNRLFSASTAISETMDLANAAGARDGMLWMKIQPVIGTSLLPKFEPAELAQIMRMDVKVANDIMLMESRAESFHLSLEVYNARRLEFTDSIPVDRVDEAMRFVEVTVDQQRKLLPRATELDSLAQQLLDALVDTLTFSRDLCGQMPQVWVKYFGSDRAPILNFDEMDTRLSRIVALRKDHRNVPG
jgi:hypothetical protein